MIGSENKLRLSIFIILMKILVSQVKSWRKRVDDKVKYLSFISSSIFVIKY